MDDGVLATENDFAGRPGLHSEPLCGHRHKIGIGGALLTTLLANVAKETASVARGPRARSRLPAKRKLHPDIACAAPE